MNNDIVVGGCRCPNPCIAHPELTAVHALPLNELADDLSLPPFWQEIWRAAETRSPGDSAQQSSFNDGAHFVITALKDAAKALVRLRKIEDAHDGPWEDEQAFQVFNRQITQAYHATSERWAEIAGVETVDSMWAIPEDDALQAPEERIAGLTRELEKNREVSIAASEQVLNLSTERVAWRKREAKLRALCDRIDKVKHLSKPGNGVKEAIVGQIRAIIGGKP